ncbi:hypothetical protein IHE45_17G025900 [Dioscorea alata]|uniref:Uncharacterized protein n=1 Tax=Dioscorea alata TaxID=55571 RepID=A0ACB7UB02_DIOAL|nr:hypothetical protein IHE45_U001700 [Dioscorea alata]KAH7657500.1 hypothetical protein IHE45_17G025900 [Dioscorea alata]
MASPSFLRSSNHTRNVVVKIIYPGRHIELHDKPIIAAEIMKKNPRCVVTHPDIFRHPWSVVSPETVLMQGKKFFVVPITTIRKLRHAQMSNPSTTALTSSQRNSSSITSPSLVHDHPGHNSNNFKSLCGLKFQKYGDDEHDDGGCFTCLVSRAKGVKQEELMPKNGMSYNIEEFHQLEEMNRRRRRMKTSFANGSSPAKLTSSNWQPSLQSISEEY